MIDLDGTEAFSETVAVEWSGAAEVLSLYPNPASSSVALEGLRQNDRAVLRDAVGRVVAEAATGADVLELGNRAAGFYIVEISRDNGAVETLPLVVR